MLFFLLVFSILKVILCSNEPVTLALDGWTNVNHHKITNLILISQGRYIHTYIHIHKYRSFVDFLVEYLADQFIPKLTELRALGVRFAGVALDNEATENAFFDRLQDQFEFLLHIPCSSHVIQLVVKKMLKHFLIQQPLQKMIEILNEISSTKELRLKVLNMAKTEKITVILTKPNATRWNSTLKSIKRFIVYKKVINYFKGNILFL